MTINTQKKKNRLPDGRRQLQANWTKELADDMKAMMCIDAEQEMIHEIRDAIDRDILDAMVETAKSKYVEKRLTKFKCVID